MGQANNFPHLGDMLKGFSQFPKIDKEAVMASHRKNLDALTEANKMAVEVMKSITQLQGQYLKQAFEDFSAVMKDTMGNVASKETAEKHGQHVKDQIAKAMDHGSAITNTLAKSKKEIFELMHNRFSESVEEFKESKEKLKKKH